MSQALRNYTKALYGFDAVIQRVPDDRWGADTPCEGWTAADLVAHAAGVLDAVAAMARTGEVAMPETPPVPDGADKLLELWGASRDGVLEALDRPGVINQVGNYWFGEATIDEILEFTTWDPLIHTWDLATATGIDGPVDVAVAEATLAYLTPRGDGIRGMQLMGPAVEVDPSADVVSRLLGFAGRDPR